MSNGNQEKQLNALALNGKASIIISLSFVVAIFTGGFTLGKHIGNEAIHQDVAEKTELITQAVSAHATTVHNGAVTRHELAALQQDIREIRDMLTKMSRKNNE